MPVCPLTPLCKHAIWGNVYITHLSECEPYIVGYWVDPPQLKDALPINAEYVAPAASRVFKAVVVPTFTLNLSPVPAENDILLFVKLYLIRPP